MDAQTNNLPEDALQRHVGDVVKEWKKKLSESDVYQSELSVNRIVAHVLGKEKFEDVDLSAKIPKEMEDKIYAMCQKRLLERVPVQYIVGKTDFLDLTLEMRNSVLVPRQDTLGLVEAVKHDWISSGREEGTILDIGCGSGNIALFLLKHLPRIRCVATDIMEQACDITTVNSKRLNLQDRLHVVQGDITSDETVATLSELGPYDSIVSNPPSMAVYEDDKVTPDHLGYEDNVALFAGEDGFYIIRNILLKASQLLKKPHGLLWLKTGPKHLCTTTTEVVRAWTEQHPETKLKYLQTFNDANGNERYCKLGLLLEDD